MCTDTTFLIQQLKQEWQQVGGPTLLIPKLTHFSKGGIRLCQALIRQEPQHMASLLDSLRLNLGMEPNPILKHMLLLKVNLKVHSQIQESQDLQILRDLHQTHLLHLLIQVLGPVERQVIKDVSTMISS